MSKEYCAVDTTTLIMIAERMARDEGCCHYLLSKMLDDADLHDPVIYKGCMMRELAERLKAATEPKKDEGLPPGVRIRSCGDQTSTSEGVPYTETVGSGKSG